jgi:hypothetical protein
LSVEYNGQEYLIPATLLVTGHAHKFIVEALGQQIIFEPDEGRNYRAVIPFENLGKEKNVDKELLEAISDILESLVNK